jgi:Putative zinc-finger
VIHFGKESRPCAAAPSERLQSFLDGELPEPRRAALIEHLDRCAECAAALQRLAERDRRLVDARPTPRPLSPAAARVLLERALAEAAVGRRKPPSGWLPLAWGFAAVFALLASGVSLAWWGPLRTARDPWSGMRRAAVPRPQPGEAPWTTIDSSPGAGSPEFGPLSPHPGDLPHGHPPLERPRPVKPGVRPVTPTLAVPRPSLPVRRRRSRVHRFVAERPARPDERHPPSSPDPAETPAPATGEEVAENTPPDQQSAMPWDGSRPQRPDSELPLQQAVLSSPEGAAGVADGGPDARAAGETPDLAVRSRSIADLQATTRSGEPSAAQALTGARQAASPPPRLLVLVADAPAPSPVTVTQAPESAPSYARAIAIKPDANGLPTWMQATASDDGTGQKLALVMLGSNPWPWIEEE